MKVLICTGIYPPQVGGPAYYAVALEREFVRQGHHPKILTYRLEHRLPVGIRHALFFVRAIFAMLGADFVIALDTFSVGFPAVIAARLLRKKIIIRTGGDFLWETYVERTHDEIPLRDFYTSDIDTCTFKERIIFLLTRYTVRHAHALVFSTEWQKNIWMKPYGLSQKKNRRIKPLIEVIENQYTPHLAPKAKKGKTAVPKTTSKTYLWAGRMIALKNVDRLRRAFAHAAQHDSSINLSILSHVPKEELMERIKTCYAFILPSLTDISPNIVLDALSLGKPCIVTEETGIVDTLGDTVLYVDPLDEVDIQKKILQLAHPEQYLVYSKRAEAFSLSHTIEDIVSEFISLYERVAHIKV